jgi:hypothetical protein
MEVAYVIGRHYNIKPTLWGYPSPLSPGTYPLNPITLERDALDYGIGADYRLFEDATLTVQAQQSMIMNRPDTMYEREIETLLWANLRVFWMNQKLETTGTIAYDPEHGGIMAEGNAWYVLTDSWKAGVAAVGLYGPSQSLFGRHELNDQLEGELVYSW